MHLGSAQRLLLSSSPPGACYSWWWRGRNTDSQARDGRLFLLLVLLCPSGCRAQSECLGCLQSENVPVLDRVAWSMAGPEARCAVRRCRGEDVSEGMPVEGPDDALMRPKQRPDVPLLGRQPEEDRPVPGCRRKERLVKGMPLQVYYTHRLMDARRGILLISLVCPRKDASSFWVRMSYSLMSWSLAVDASHRPFAFHLTSRMLFLWP